MEITAEVSKISKTVRRDLIFIFNLLSEYVIHFLPNAVCKALENVISFT